LPIAESLMPVRERPVSETDEIWSYIGKKQNPVRIWLALERQTRRTVGIAFGDRSAAGSGVIQTVHSLNI
jgi:IS1 family transposase